jgi:hypothetical protein
MPGCQVIKSNDQWCRNYARKGMACCWVHRNLEDTGKVILSVKFKQPEDGREWPTLDEVRNVILTERIDNNETLYIFQKIWLGVAESENWSKYDRRMLGLIITEFYFKYPEFLTNKRLLHTVIDKLIEANYDPIYTHFASQLNPI